MLPATQRPKAPKRSLELSPRTRHVLISVSLLLSFSFLFPFALSQTLQVHGMKEAKAYRFAYGVSGLLFWFGAPIRDFIEKYLGLLFTLFVVLLLGGFVAVRYVF